MPSRALRLFHTVRHLKTVQIAARVQKRLARVRPDLSPAPPPRPPAGAWVEPVAKPASVADGGQVRFLNEDGEIARPGQWNDSAKGKLWLYNLHYFDDLGAAGSDGRRSLQRTLIARWIAENPPPAGNGWEPYPVSLRIVNWIKWHLAGEFLDESMRDSLAMQVRWLMGHIEWHLLGNHILANAKALVFAGLFFSGAEAERWLARGLAIYERELPEQILDDGGHFELSPMYHAIILEDVLDLINAARHYGRVGDRLLAGLSGIAQRMRGWLAVMTHPDGGPAFFNDCAFGMAASRADLEAYAAKLGLSQVAEPGEGVHHLSASGYVRVNRGDMAAILDVAAIGPDYIPGHAHADTLSFELSIGGERVIVNCGTSTYAPGPQREAERATAAHSTVEIDGENSSEVWAAFRVARRAHVVDLDVDTSGGGPVIRAAHDGYRRLPSRPLHRRTWRFAHGALTVNDIIEVGTQCAALARFHLAPAVVTRSNSEPHRGELVTGTGRSIGWTSSEPVRLTPGYWAREFGLRHPTTAIEASLGMTGLVFAMNWSS